MAKRGWKPGQSGNPAGRPKAPPEVHLGREITDTEMRGIFARLMRMSFNEIGVFLKNGQNSVHELAVARILYEAISKGNPKHLEFLYTRLFGRSSYPSLERSADATVGSLNQLVALAMEQMRARGERDVEALQEPPGDSDPE